MSGAGPVEFQARILQALFRAVDEVNQQLGPERGIRDKSPAACLYGPSSGLDSLAFVTFIVLAEQQIGEEFHVNLTLADEKAMSQKNSPFRSIEALAAYVAEVLKEKKIHG
jgi:hypothetical protein